MNSKKPWEGLGKEQCNSLWRRFTWEHAGREPGVSGVQSRAAGGEVDVTVWTRGNEVENEEREEIIQDERNDL